MLWQYYESTLIMKNDEKKFEQTSSWRQFDVNFGMTSPVAPKNLENRNFELDVLKIIARKCWTPHFFRFLKLFLKKHEAMLQDTKLWELLGVINWLLLCTARKRPWRDHLGLLHLPRVEEFPLDFGPRGGLVQEEDPREIRGRASGMATSSIFFPFSFL